MGVPHTLEVVMVLDALRGYVQLASGLTEVNRRKAVAEAKSLLATGGALEQMFGAQAKDLADDVGRQVQTLADDLLATSKANRQMLTTLIRAETERAVGALGLATAEDISSLRRHVERLEQRLAAQSAATPPAKKVPAKKVPVATPPAKKVPAKKVPAKKSAPATPPAKKPAPPKTAPAPAPDQRDSP